jgi:hypothetical protein
LEARRFADDVISGCRSIGTSKWYLAALAPRPNQVAGRCRKSSRCRAPRVRGLETKAAVSGFVRVQTIRPYETPAAGTVHLALEAVAAGGQRDCLLAELRSTWGWD